MATKRPLLVIPNYFQELRLATITVNKEWIKNSRSVLKNIKTAVEQKKIPHLVIGKVTCRGKFGTPTANFIVELVEKKRTIGKVTISIHRGGQIGFMAPSKFQRDSWQTLGIAKMRIIQKLQNRKSFLLTGAK